MSFELGPLDPESKIDDTRNGEIVPAIELPAIPSTPEEILGVKATASPKEIRDAYYAKAKLYHPSRNNYSDESHRWMRALVDAREALLHSPPMPPPSREQIKKEFQNRDPKEIVRKRKERNAPSSPFKEGRI